MVVRGRGVIVPMESQAIAYRASWRIAAAILIVISRASLLAFVAFLLFLDARLNTPLRLGNPLRLMRAFSIFCLAPGIGAWLLERALAVKVLIQSGALVLQRRRQRIEIPCEAIERVAPWTVPLPSGGLWLRLKSGRRFRYGLQVADPVTFIEGLVDAGAPQHVRAAAQHPAAVYARSRNTVLPRWYHRVLKFVVFALVPTLPLFRLHQWIAYGGTFGEYYTYGLKAYVLGLAIYWAALTIYLVLYAAVLRAVAEPAVLAAAYAAPSRAARVRRAVEITHRILYYGGVPVFLIWFLLAS
jgi:apolipoprotein N-acyltransferase